MVTQELFIVLLSTAEVEEVYHALEVGLEKGVSEVNVEVLHRVSVNFIISIYLRVNLKDLLFHVFKWLQLLCIDVELDVQLLS